MFFFLTKNRYFFHKCFLFQLKFVFLTNVFRCQTSGPDGGEHRRAGHARVHRLRRCLHSGAEGGGDKEFIENQTVDKQALN